MMPMLIDADGTPPQPWRNGGGQTRELLAWPASDAWRLRISRADITQDGPFSAFPGVQRWFTVLEGAGVVLHFDGDAHRLRPGDAPCAFDGTLAPGCTLLDGATQDLNLMARGGRATMQAWHAGTAFTVRDTMAGLYTLVAGRWSSPARTLDVAAHHLLWAQDAAACGGAAWHFTPHTAPPATAALAWWMGFTPGPRPPTPP